MDSKLFCYAMFDVRGKKYGLPFYADCDDVAVRNFDIQMEHWPDRYKDDVQLVKLASFDACSGKFESFPDPIVLGTCNSLFGDATEKDVD